MVLRTELDTGWTVQDRVWTLAGWDSACGGEVLSECITAGRRAEKPQNGSNHCNPYIVGSSAVSSSVYTGALDSDSHPHHPGGMAGPMGAGAGAGGRRPPRSTAVTTATCPR